MDTSNRYFTSKEYNTIVLKLTSSSYEYSKNQKEYDLLIIPGGVKALEKLRQENAALLFINEWDKNKKAIGSICHGGQMLISSKIVAGRDVSGYYSIKDDLICVLF